MEKIRFYNEENGYLVGLLRCRDGELVTFVGNFPPVQEGEALKLTGKWQMHDRYGRQLLVDRWERLIPATREGLRRYLSSGLIKGIGPVTAENLVQYFGLDVLDIIEHEPERLQELSGIGPKKAAIIAQSYQEHKEIQNVMVFLQSYGIGLSQALRLYRHYGPRTIEKVKNEPYHLAEEVFGIGFKSADRIARQFGLREDAPERVRAAISFALSQAAEEGHVYLPVNLLQKRVQDLLTDPSRPLPDFDFEQQLDELTRERKVHQEKFGDVTSVYKASFYHAEKGVAERLQLLMSRQRQWSDELIKTSLASVFKKCGELTVEQQQVLRQALQNGVSIVTGGPGTGKTTTIKALILLFDQLKQKVILAAPTGRAAKRVTEATNREASTIHRLLEYSFVEGEGFKFQRHEERPLEAGVIIIDEASMIDLMLMFHLLKAIPAGCRLILVGDVDQLPAVGAGNVLKDLITSCKIPYVRLQNVFRQARESMIIVNAHRVNQGWMPQLNCRNKDFFFQEEEDIEQVSRIIVQLCRERIPNYGPFDPVKDIQVITPMRRTPAGVDRLNRLLQAALNPPGRHRPEVPGRGFVFRQGDKVMQIRNNYQKEVFNGDIGFITAIDPEEGELVVTFHDLITPRPVIYDLKELDELTLSYTISVHKSQGSEYPVIIMPVVTQHYLLLQRNLLYTAITRARKLVVLVGTKKALGIAVRNNRVEERFSMLHHRLAKGGSLV